MQGARGKRALAADGSTSGSGGGGAKGTLAALGRAQPHLRAPLSDARAAFRRLQRRGRRLRERPRSALSVQLSDRDGETPIKADAAGEHNMELFMPAPASFRQLLAIASRVGSSKIGALQPGHSRPSCRVFNRY